MSCATCGYSCRRHRGVVLTPELWGAIRGRATSRAIPTITEQQEFQEIVADTFRSWKYAGAVDPPSDARMRAIAAEKVKARETDEEWTRWESRPIPPAPKDKTTEAEEAEKDRAATRDADDRLKAEAVRRDRIKREKREARETVFAPAAPTACVLGGVEQMALETASRYWFRAACRECGYQSEWAVLEAALQHSETHAPGSAAAFRLAMAGIP